MITMHYWIAKHRLQQSGSSLNVGPGPTDAALRGLTVVRLAIVNTRSDRCVLLNERRSHKMPRRPMAVFRRSKKKPSAPVETADLHASLQVCLEKVQQLERENETHIKRMAAMQAELDHLRAIISRTSMGS
jgi:hypothetical protein